jgi:hypothetical protein
MTMIVKFMSSENRVADTDSRKSFRIVSEVDDIDFGRNDRGTPIYTMVRPPRTPGGESIIEASDVIGNVYVMNEAGKTIATFNPDKIDWETRS